MAKHQQLDHGETFTHGGYEFRVTFEHDSDIREPWKEYDGHGKVSEWTSRDKAPGERVLCSDRRSKRFYDVRASVEIARRDRWGCSNASHAHATTGETAACAVDRDFEYLRAFCAGDWEYLIVGVTLLDDDGEPTSETEYLGAVESIDRQYLADTAHELAEQIISRIEVADPDVQVSNN